MRAMILAAGLGTRLRPLTLVRPKVLAPLMGTPVLDFWITRLHQAGIESVVINAFHMHDKLAKAVNDREWPIPVRLEVEHEIYGTGGGIRSVLDFFGDQTFVVLNGDIICDAPLEELHQEHIESGCPVSLLMHDFPQFNNVAVDQEEKILEFGEIARKMTGNGDGTDLMAFTGIHYINPSALEGVSPRSYSDIVSVYRRLLRDGSCIHALRRPGLFWREMGSVQSYVDLHQELSRLQVDALQPLQTGDAVVIHPEARIDPQAKLSGLVAVGRNSRISEGAVIESSILWDDVQVAPGAHLRNCVVADGVNVDGFNENKTLARVTA
jgi:mannose-1-phosphate guanylyltransferase